MRLEKLKHLLSFPTNRAYKMALESTADDIPKFTAKAKAAYEKSDKLMKQEKWDEAMRVGVEEGQMYREAAETLQGQPQHAKSFAEFKEKYLELTKYE